jgi:HD-GYP domain-containing protein (c-di-GMP phosphodiesterase class II)
VAKYSRYIGEELGLANAKIEHLHQSALMHDVGKLAVPGQLLNKPGRLTPEEWDIVKRHNTAGIDILARVDFMRTMAVTASDLHGRFDAEPGTTTPADLVLEAHIVAVADAFDAMTSTRAYRRALAQDVAYEELRANAGSQFNPACVEALITVIDRRGERYGAGFEQDVHEFAVPPPEAGVGSAGLGDLEIAT